MSKKILMLAGDFSEDYETMVPYQALSMLGYQVDVVCPDKKAGDTIATAIHDFVGFQTYAELRGHNFVLTADFDSVNPADYDGLYITGGRAPEYLRLNKRVMDIVDYFLTNDLPLAAICHGPQILACSGKIQGRTMTSYAAVGPDLVVAGANYKEVDPADVVIDGNLVTSPAWPGNTAICRAFAEILGAKIEV